MAIPAYLLVHTASVEPYEGSGAYGDIFGPAFDLPCYFEQQHQLVTSATGDQAVSKPKLWADLTDTEVKTGSRVTVNGYVSTVTSVSVFDDGGLTGLAHQEIQLD